jgi:uncharacterized phage protein gp47/JayE
MSRTLEGILEQMRGSLQESNSELASFPEYGNLYAIFRAVAASIIEQDVKLDGINSNLFLNTATGESLDLKAQEFNITRNKGTYASGSVLVTGNNTFIPKNTILTEPSSGLQFIVQSDVVSSFSKTKCTVVATEYSDLSNLISGTELSSGVYPSVRFIVGNYFDPITSKYIGNLIGGEAKETDDELKDRILTNIQSLSLSNIESIKLAAQEIEGVNKISVVENEPSLGYITVYINNTETKFLKLVKTELDLIKPIGTALQIKPFVIVPVDINISIQAYNTIEKSELRSLIQSNVQQYINNLNAGAIFTKETLASFILQIPQIYNEKIMNY